MSRALVPVLVLLAACSYGLEPWADDTDTGIDVGGPDDTGVGDPIDTGDTGDTGPADNETPVADAGPDQAAMVGDIVHLDGSGSLDPNGDELTFAWVMTARPVDSGTNLLDGDEPLPRFYADVPGTFTLTLTVSDGELEATDDIDVVIEAPNEPPVADAGPDAIVTQGDNVQLNGVNSYDPEGDALNFQWLMTSKPSGSTASLIDATTAYPRFTADAAGEYNVQLIVDDGVNESGPDAVRITADAAGTDTGGDCGASCSAIVRQQLRHRLSLGSVASGPGLALLGLGLLVVGRRRR